MILIIAIFLRSFQLDSGFGYFGDQGRDLLVLHQWFFMGQMPLIGPSASIGGFHLGPIYYYLLAPGYLIGQETALSAIIVDFLGNIFFIFFIFLFLRKIIDFSTAFIFLILASFSPHAIFLSRGSWNPNLIPFLSILFILTTYQFIKSAKWKFIFLSFLLVGVGVQLHYTFVINLIGLLFAIAILKKETFLNKNFYIFSMLGLIVPLAPFLIGQFITNFEDVKNLISYIVNLKTSNVFLTPNIILSYLIFPFTTFFPTDQLPFPLKLLTTPIYLLILLIVFLISLSKTNLSLISKIILIIFMTGFVLSIRMGLRFYDHYFYGISGLVLLMVSLIISYLFKYAKLKILWAALFVVFLGWEISLMPGVYQISRTPQAVYKITNEIIKDYKANASSKPVGIYVISPVTLKEGYEYRYELEKNKITTFSAINFKDIDYLIFEKSDNLPVNLMNFKKNKKVILIKNLIFNDNSRLIKFAEIYRLENFR